MNARFLLALALWLAALAPGAARSAPALDADDVARLAALPAEGRASATLRWREIDDSRRSDRAVEQVAELRRIEVYAPDARVVVVGDSGPVELPRDARAHFIGRTAAGERIALSMAADGSAMDGTLIGPQGVFDLRGERDADGIALRAVRTDVETREAMKGTPTCGSAPRVPLSAVIRGPKASAAQRLPKTAVRQAVVAVDTDNELLSIKFSNNTANATAYIASLFTALNAIYEDDPAQNGLQLRMVQGNVTLRPSTTPDPYPSTSSTGIDTQLTEFGEYWRVNQSGVSRAFAMMLSGKLSGSAASGFFGIAWVLETGTYCTQTGFVFGNPPSTAGHYSVNRVNTVPGTGAGADATFVGHELGHNLGANHTHCSSSTTGLGIVSTGTIDRCFNGESSFGCYSGTQSCPNASESPVAPVGSIMSYCHLTGCGIAGEFQSAHRNLLDARLDSQPTSCIGPLTTNQAPTINAPAGFAGTEDQPASLAGIVFADADAGSGALTATLSVPAGAVNATAFAGVTIGGTATARTLSGTLTALNGSIAAGNVSYLPAANANGSVALSIAINDNGNSGGAAQSASLSRNINVAAVNDAPTLSLPASIAGTEDQAAPLVPIGFADVDAGSAALVATFSVPAGTVSASGTPLVVVGGTPTARTLTGSLSDLNGFLSNGLVTYTGAANANGSVPLTVTVNDQGASGGAAQQAQATAPLQLAAVNDPPTVTAPASSQVIGGQTVPLAGVSFADPDSPTGTITVLATFSAASGSFTATSGGGVTVSGAGTGTLTLTGTLSAINSRLSSSPVAYSAAATASGTVPITISVNDQGNTGGPAQSGAATVNISVIAADTLFLNGFED
jgi:hypothetical protein